MRDKGINAISRLRPGKRPSFMSRIAGIRCPECKTVQPFYYLEKTNPGKGRNKYTAHECQKCKQLLFLTGKERNKRFCLMNGPVLFLTAFIGGYLITLVDWLSYYNEARRGLEPNFLGFLMMITFFVMPGQLFLQRWEDIAVLAKKDAAT